MKKQESVRSILRSIIPKRLYIWGADVLNITHIIRTNGIGTYLQLYSTKSSQRNYATVHLKNIPYPISFRPSTPDVNTIIQNLIRQEYGQFPEGFEASLIIDGGGYIGDVSIYFLNHFQNCRVLMVEPDQENFKLAQENLAHYSDRVFLIPGGLWSHKTEMYVMGSYVDSRLTNDTSSGTTKISVIDIPTLMQDYGITHIDILKLDVEGAEEEILCVNNEWLTKVKAVVVEFHGEEIKRKCVQSLQNYGFKGLKYRSLHYFLQDGLVE